MDKINEIGPINHKITDILFKYKRPDNVEIHTIEISKSKTDYWIKTIADINREIAKCYMIPADILIHMKNE